jgi:nucleoside-triphosphatase
MIILLSGSINSGKSSTIYKIVQQLLQEKLLVGGIVSLPILQEGRKAGYEAVCLLTHKTTHLAQLNSLVPNPAPDDITIGQWVIFNEGMQFCYQQIEEAIQKKVQLLVIDEIGPLEIQGKGFRSLLDQILLKQEMVPFQLLLIVRTNMVEEVKRLYPNHDFKTIYQQENLLDVLGSIINTK